MLFSRRPFLQFWRPRLHSALPRVSRLVLWALLATLLPAAMVHAAAEDPIERVSRATAFVKQTPAGEGTAFCIDPAGLFITNVHVLNGLNMLATVPLVLDSGTPNERTVMARSLSSNNEWDLALLKVDSDQELPFLPMLPAEDEPALGTEVRAFGFPFGTLVDARNPSITMNQGRVSSLGRDEAGILETIRFDAVVNFGNSGGPLVDSKGRVVGVVTAKMAPPADRTSFAVSLPRLREFLSQPGLGLHVDPIPWKDRGEAADFHIGLVTDFGSQKYRPTRPDRIELDLSADSGQTWQTSVAAVPDDAKEVVIQAVADPREELKLLVRRGQGPQLKPGELVPLTDRVIAPKVKGRLSDAARLIRIPDDKVQIELRSGGAPRMLAADLVDGEKYLPDGTWNASVVHIDDPHVGFIQARIRGLTGDTVVRTIQLTFPLAERPLYAGFPGDPMQLDKEGPVDAISIQVGLEGQVTFAVGVMAQTPESPAGGVPADATDDEGLPAAPQLRDITGLMVQFPFGQVPPGEHSLAGPFVRVNGRMWHYATPATQEHPPNLLPMELAEGTWDCDIARDYAAGTTEKELQKNEVQIEKTEQGIALTLSTPAGKRASYRLRFHPVEPTAESP